MKKKKGFVCVLLVIAMLSACTGEQQGIYEQNTDRLPQEVIREDSQGEENGGDLSGELKINKAFSYVEKKFADEFMEIHPKVNIIFEENVIEDDNDLRQQVDRVAVELMSGESADIVGVMGMDYDRIARNGLLCDLYPFMEADPEFHQEEYFTNVFQALEVEGRLYVMPLNFTPKMVWLDKEITESLGIDINQYDMINAEQILDIYEAAEAKGLLLEEYTLDHEGPAHFVENEKNAYLNIKNKNVNFAGSHYVDFLKRVMQIEEPERGWDRSGFVMTYSDLRPPEDKDSFIFSDWSIDPSHILWLENEYDVWNNPIPYATTTGQVGFTCDLMAIASSSDNQELAWEFIRYCISAKDPSDYGKGEQDVWYKDLFGHSIPVNRLNCWRMIEEIYAGNVNEITYESFIQIAESCNYMPAFSYDLQSAWGSLEEDYFYRGLLSTEEFVQQMQERTEIYFNE